MNMELAKSNNADTWKDGNEEYEYLTLYRAEADFCDEFLLELDIDGDATTIANTEPYWFRAYMNWRKDEVNLPGNTTTASDGWGSSTPRRPSRRLSQDMTATASAVVRTSPLTARCTTISPI